MNCVALLLAALAGLSLPASADNVYVSDRSVSVNGGRILVKPKDAATYTLDGRKHGDVITITLLPNTPSEGWVTSLITQTQFDRWQRGLSYEDTVVTSKPLSLRYVAQSSESLNVLFLNTTEQAGSATYTMSFERRVPKSAVEFFHNMLQSTYNGLRKNYIFTPFRLSIQPCGHINAYSLPDVLICSELVNALHENGNIEALYPVLYHELAHTLLYLWGDPRAADEDVADELGLFLTLSINNRQQAATQLYRLSDWFGTLDTSQEYLHQVYFGGRHSLSIQRIKKIQLMLQGQAASDTVWRWSKYLIPHMTNASLRFNLSATNPKVAPAARAELSRRGIQ